MVPYLKKHVCVYIQAVLTLSEIQIQKRTVSAHRFEGLLLVFLAKIPFPHSHSALHVVKV